MVNGTGAEFYIPQERFPAAGFTVAIVGGALIAFPLGAAYGSVQALMPLIYICLVIALGFSALLGHAVFAVLKLGRVRHLGVGTVAAVTSSLAALTGAWMADRYIRIERIILETHAEGTVHFFVSPSEFMKFISYYFHEGFWGLAAGLPMFGIPLALIWVAEAALVILLCLRVVRRKLREMPFCEGCKRWTGLTKGVRYLVPKTVRALIDELNRGNARALLQVLPTSRGVPLSLRVDLAQCGSCEASTYLTMSVVTGGSKFREFVWPEEKAEVHHLKISAEDARELRQPPKLAQMAPPPTGPRPRLKK
jgi:hypothetical protein